MEPLRQLTHAATPGTSMEVREPPAVHVGHVPLPTTACLRAGVVVVHVRAANLPAAPPQRASSRSRRRSRRTSPGAVSYRRLVVVARLFASMAYPHLVRGEGHLAERRRPASEPAPRV